MGLEVCILYRDARTGERKVIAKDNSVSALATLIDWFESAIEGGAVAHQVLGNATMRDLCLGDLERFRQSIKTCLRERDQSIA